MNWYQKTTQSVIDEFNSNHPNGLSSDEAQKRLQTSGRNLLASRKKESLFSIFLRQFKNPLIYILIFAALLIVVIGQKTDAVVIFTLIAINAVIGTIQEGRARNSLEQLKSLTNYKTLVRRDGQESLIPSEEIVCGDILILHEGDRVAADARLLQAESLSVDESILTGEAYPVNKISQVIDKENLSLGDQKNIIFSGTSVSSGYGEAVVVATGLTSELGKISKELLETSTVPLPLDKKITKLTSLIALSVLTIAIIVFVLGVIKGIPTLEIFAAVVGLSVSIIPEGLPVVVTIVLARGVWRMAKSKAIVRQMAAVEAMGSADTLLVDKTGTVTTGTMSIKQILFDGEMLEVEGNGYSPQGNIASQSDPNLEKLKEFLAVTYLSLKADVIEENGKWHPVGDSTEAAVAVLCRKAGHSKSNLTKEFETIQTKPFDAKKRYIEATFSRNKETWDVYVGAPEFLIKDLKLDHDLTRNYKKLTEDGLRVVGVAVYGPKENQLFGYALLAIDEEIRTDVRESILEAKKAGFKIAMMTGDFANTARSIAYEVGIFSEGEKILTGEEVEQMSEEELLKQVEQVTVFARITPSHKLKIVNAFKKKGHIVAMTGDGVNDGPALQAADLGIGLGSGTQVAKDSSDIVLVDDGFSTITSAIAEGRSIYLTLKKVILYLFSTSFGEVLVISSALLLGFPLPLVAVQIIWLNFVTDGFLDISLAQDPPEKGLKRSKDQNLVDRLMVGRILIMGFSMLIVTLPIFYFYSTHYSLSYARSMALLVLSVIQWLNVLNVRSSDVSVFKLSLTNNRFLLGAFVVVILLEYIGLQTSFGNNLLHTTALSITDWLIALFASLVIIFTEEIRKYFTRVRKLERDLVKI